MIPVYGFGDKRTKHKKVFNLLPDTPSTSVTGRSCHGFNQVLQAYNQTQVVVSGPTSFGPIINHAVEIVKHTGTYHILFIITDGEVCDSGETEQAIVSASHYPLSIVIVGVGDGPFTMMEHYDDHLPQRVCDNLQFVNYQKVIKTAMRKEIPVEIQFAIEALQEIPDHYDFLRKNKKLCLPGTERLNRQWELITQGPETNPLEKQKSAKNIDICPVCLDESDSVFDPCGHTICMACGKNIKECPICRTKVNKMIRVYPS